MEWGSGIGLHSSNPRPLMSALGQKRTFAPSSLAERSAEFIVQSTEKNAVGGNGCA